MPVKARSLFMACFLVVARAASIVFGADESFDLVFPRDDRQQVKAVISDVLNGIEKNDSSIRNVWVKGTFLLAEGEGLPPEHIDTQLLKSHKFMWLIRDGKRRYEEDVIQRIGEVQEEFTGYRLMNDKGIFRLTRKQLSIFPLVDAESRWQRQTVNFSDFQMVHDLGHSVSFPQFLSSCIACIDDKVENNDAWWKRLSIKCSRTGCGYHNHHFPYRQTTI